MTTKQKVKRKMREIGFVDGEIVMDFDDWDSGVRCPGCGLFTGNRTEHTNFRCASCGYLWREATDFPEPEIFNLRDEIELISRLSLTNKGGTNETD